MLLSARDRRGCARAIAAEPLADSRLRSDEAPLVGVAGALPPFQQRLTMIATAIAAYEKFECGLARYRPAAEHLRG